jgi:hypothetical protein
MQAASVLDGSSGRRRAHTGAPRLRLILDVELEGDVAFEILFVGAPDYASRKRLWWWARTRPGFEDSLERLLASIDRLGVAA